jgi:hypothetical protein
MAWTFPDNQVIAEHVDPRHEPMGDLIVRCRTELKQPVPPAIPRGRAA